MSSDTLQNVLGTAAIFAVVAVGIGLWVATR